MPRVTLWIDEEDLEAVRALAEERGLTLDDVAQELLMRKLPGGGSL
jgi:predicted DNA binding CopG/RHH family protein